MTTNKKSPSQQIASQSNNDCINDTTVGAKNQDLLEIIEKIPALDLERLYIGIEDDAQKASFIMQEVTENYFNRYNPSQNHFEIDWNFNRMGVFCDVVADYISKIQKQAKELNATSQELFNIKKAAESLITEGRCKNED